MIIWCHARTGQYDDRVPLQGCAFTDTAGGAGEKHVGNLTMGSCRTVPGAFEGRDSSYMEKPLIDDQLAAHTICGSMAHRQPSFGSSIACAPRADGNARIRSRDC